MARSTLGGILACTLLFACGSDEAAPPLAVPPGCNPLASEHDCLLPYPSDFYLEGSGEARRVVVPEAALPADVRGATIDFLAHHPADGFSVGNQILALFPQGIDEADLVGPGVDPAASLEPGSATVILEAATGRRVLHMAELDPRAKDATRRTLVIRPLERLAEDTRYVVAIRGLRDPSGAALAPPEGFRRLRDGIDDPALAPLGRYESDVFAPLEAAGIARAELTLAWDFTTRTRPDAIGDMLAVREAAMAAFAATPPAISVVEVIDDPGAESPIGRRIEATLTVPLYMEDAAPFAALHREGGAIAQNGTVAIPVTIVVPDSVMDRPPGTPPARLVQFGHGFFGNRHEILGSLSRIADERGFVLVAADWWGMMEDDRSALIPVLDAAVGEAFGFIDRVHQGMVNFMAVAEAAEAMASLPELQIDGASAIDPAERYFYGISQGAILGGTYAALSPAIDRAALGVGGSCFSLMMFRAGPFAPFLLFIGLALPDPVDQQKYVMLSQTTFDRIDPLSFAPFYASPLPDGPSEKRLLSQIGIGDIAVPNLSAHLFARAAGLSLLDPAVRPLAGLSLAEGPLARALIEHDFGVEESLIASPPINDNGVHGGLRELDAVNEQIDRFFRPDGLIEATCDGPCDPE